MTSNHRDSRGFLALALLGAALLAVSVVGCGKDTTPARAAGGAKAQEPHPVRVVAAAVGPFPRTVTVTGTLAADEEVVAGFKVAGRVSEIAVDLGSPVRKGQLLARLDPTDFRLRVEQAEAALRQVRAGLGLPRDGSARKRRSREDRAGARGPGGARGGAPEPGSNGAALGKEFDRPVRGRRVPVQAAGRREPLSGRPGRDPEPSGIARRAELGPRPGPAAAVRRGAERADRRGRAGTPRFGGRVPGRRRSGVRPGPGPPAPASGGGAGTGRTLRAGRAGGPGPAGGGPRRRTPVAWPA